jgi:predicted RNase H-like nuclease
MAKVSGTEAPSVEAFSLLPEVREIDAVISPELQGRVREIHPELSFRELAGAAMAHPKETAEGFEERRRRLQSALPSATIPSRSAAGRLVPGADADDLLDAIVASWTASRVVRGQARILPEGGEERDSRGLLMEMVC